MSKVSVEGVVDWVVAAVSVVVADVESCDCVLVDALWQEARISIRIATGSFFIWYVCGRKVEDLGDVHVIKF